MVAGRVPPGPVPDYVGSRLKDVTVDLRYGFYRSLSDEPDEYLLDQIINIERFTDALTKVSDKRHAVTPIKVREECRIVAGPERKVDRMLAVGEHESML